MPTTTDYDHALARFRKRAAEMGPEARRGLPLTRLVLQDLARLGDPATLGETLAEVDRAYRQVMSEIAVPQQRAREEVTP